MIRILGIDPGTNAAGAAVVAFDDIGRPFLEDFTRIITRSKSKDKDTAARERISFMCEQLGYFTLKHSDWIQAVAYERAFHRGQDATTILMHCTGAMLNLPGFDGKEILPVYSATVKSVQRSAGMAHQSNANSAAQKVKRDMLKANGVFWFNHLFGYSLTDDQHEIADAVAVCIGGYKVWSDRQIVQRPLLGAGSGRRRKVAV